MTQLDCEICGGQFSVKPYRAKIARFCSHKCGGKWHMSVRKMPSDHKVGNKWRCGLRPTNAFTSEQAKAMNAVQGAIHVCAQCGSSFEIKPWLERQNKTKSGRRFCGRPCHSAWKAAKESGENAADYVGGITTYRGKGWPEARRAAIERDGSTCQECGLVVGPSISVHHIRPYRLFACAAEANVLPNLLCLCQPCHMRIERAAGHATLT